MKVVRYRVLAAPVDAVNMEQSLQFVDEYIANPSNKIGYILAVNPEKVYVLKQNEFLREFFEKASLLICDGIGMVWALRILYGIKISRVPGADLMQKISQQASVRKYRIFIYGASEEVSSAACNELQRCYPGINIVGRANGFVSPDQMPDLIRRINSSQAQILFIALGSPRQEQWMAAYAEQLTSVKLCQGIGGTLDTIAGTVKRAPVFWQRLGLEWFFRLLCQPSRIKRQLNCFRFGLAVLHQRIFFRGKINSQMGTKL